MYPCIGIFVIGTHRCFYFSSQTKEWDPTRPTLAISNILLCSTYRGSNVIAGIIDALTTMLQSKVGGGLLSSRRSFSADVLDKYSRCPLFSAFLLIRVILTQTFGALKTRIVWFTCNFARIISFVYEYFEVWFDAYKLANIVIFFLKKFTRLTHALHLWNCHY